MIDARIEGRAGRITLASPGTLNALTADGIRQIQAALDAWGDGPDLIVIDAEGDRAFCAGGDIVEIYRALTAGAPVAPFWAAEYRLNARLAAWPRPVVTLMQGHVLGGGVGIGCHASHRVVAETAKIAMPECAIGFVPDVGGTHLLAQAPGHAGEVLGLTGTRMGPGDAIWAGFADLHIPRDRWPEAVAALLATGDPAALADLAVPADAPLAERDLSAGGLATPPEIAAALSPEEAKRLAAQCPLSVWAALALIRAARAEPGLVPALAREYRAGVRIAATPEMAEGIRAAVIDKDRSPRWQHRLDTVPPEAVAALLAPIDPEWTP